ncbi:bis(5'-nucleosyl)-tetraphosphatase (symmetrical) YqeK [Faecalispora anaeroviscerum]|uniref:bis(5'-nucleosyl)-tetraphosphatase (symmetrical) YqeK n=1 Tax=Faecalispora anaeroviscerum TaxID=2991836 RepID=UPI0024B9A828|nr:bis(5'-nucleosyl)-tetraphosphatase (symmetrical) YqeK [Faecalispora anaeroviscerum]
MDEKQYEEIVRSRLSDKRFQHSRNVAKAAQELAVLNGENPQKARLAGILHDIMKEAPPEEQLKIMAASGIILTDVERSAPKLWHAMAGAAYLRDVLGFQDQEILDAVRYHTTGRANMSVLEKIVFVADFISDERDYEGVQELREAARRGLQEAVLAGLIFTIQDLSQNQKPIHPDSVAAYNEEIVSRGKK